MTNEELTRLEDVAVELNTALERLNERKNVDIESTAKIAHAIGVLDGMINQADAQAIAQAQDMEDRGDDSGKFEAEVEK